MATSYPACGTSVLGVSAADVQSFGVAWKGTEGEERWVVLTGRCGAAKERKICVQITSVIYSVSTSTHRVFFN